ncbi:hypothetical protein ALC56_03320 [Trachymyrmex septentrionalis]|uniref:Uncharacterized protein n=1 Tax=Trachymyrmex septentrionalis TaxID=34720 RepID=A0A195FPF1_9HYME|nr:hypothetical protein ALC56_03320 [Trachymyrmex septentrionalis]
MKRKGERDNDRSSGSFRSSAGLAGLHKDELGNMRREGKPPLSSKGHDGAGHGYLGTSTINVENFSAAILSLRSLFESFWNISPTCLLVPDFTIIADTSTKCRPKSFEDIAYLSTRCLICFETWTSTPSAGDNDR